MQPTWFLSREEIQLSRMTQVLFWSLGALAGGFAREFWNARPIVAVGIAIGLYLLGNFIWKRLAERIIGRNMDVLLRSPRARL